MSGVISCPTSHVSLRHVGCSWLPVHALSSNTNQCMYILHKCVYIYAHIRTYALAYTYTHTHTCSYIAFYALQRDQHRAGCKHAVGRDEEEEHTAMRVRLGYVGLRLEFCTCECFAAALVCFEIHNKITGIIHLCHNSLAHKTLCDYPGLSFLKRRKDK